VAFKEFSELYGHARASEVRQASTFLDDNTGQRISVFRAVPLASKRIVQLKANIQKVVEQLATKGYFQRQLPTSYLGDISDDDVDDALRGGKQQERKTEARTKRDKTPVQARQFTIAKVKEATATLSKKAAAGTAPSMEGAVAALQQAQARAAEREAAWRAAQADKTTGAVRKEISPPHERGLGFTPEQGLSL